MDNGHPNAMASTGGDKPDRKVIFIQNDEPPLKAGDYTLSVTQTTNTAKPNSFSTSRQFAVSGERFSFQSGEIDSVFPPNLANGEFDGSLPCVVFNRQTLPWERYLIEGNQDAPWLAVLLFDADSKPDPKAMTAKDLVKQGETITVYGNPSLTGTGALPSGTFSYPGINPLDYGETPDTPCTVIDVDLALFNRIAPSVNDLEYLVHIREVDTIDTAKNTSEETSYAVVMGNRIGQNNAVSYACLVSLENMGTYLPDDDGTPATTFPDGTRTVRLICYRSWQFTANTLDQNFLKLVEDLNAPGPGGQKLTTLQFPTGEAPPTGAQVTQALAAQASGSLTGAQAKVLAQNAFGQGYVPMNEEFRQGATGVSWYRGPCLPLQPSATTYTQPKSSDAANRYNPETGLFDVSYGAAWQLGQLLALRNKAYANALYNWKKAVTAAEASAAEQAVLEQALSGDGDTAGAPPFAELLARRRRALASPPPLPDVVATWLGQLKLLTGVPFQYLVPHDSMLPLESLRFFTLDMTWVDYLVDGAFSIGRASSVRQQQDLSRFPRVSAAAGAAMHRMRRQRTGQVFAATDGPPTYTGFFLRSQVLSGWPNLQVNGYATPDDLDSEIKKLRLALLGPTCLFCLFDGDVQQVAVHQPPEQLHSGVELDVDGIPFSTTLRAVTGATPGAQFTSDPKGGPAIVTTPMRSDQQTLEARNAADTIKAKLNSDFNQGITTFTSAEFALEMVKGVVKVNFNRQS
ncbi:MAG: hypothetical protein NXI18_13580 [Alphaproteobacteria bacterium]|nr:hypothetical protein [Alphaproteobacteria bacterium]